MKAFLDWFNAKDDIDPVLKAAIAHLWFVTIHPFDDGNGRIARAIADMALGAVGRQLRSAFTACRRRSGWSAMPTTPFLKQTQKGNLDITPWLKWFLDCLNKAIDGAQNILAAVLRKAEFWKKHAATPFNERQRNIVNRLLDGFEGKLTSSKWAKLEKRPPIPRCATSTTLSPVASSSAMKAADAAPVIRWIRSRLLRHRDRGRASLRSGRH